LIIGSAIVFFADRLIRPITESYEKQNRFVTDAGHEIKTPLTIINANIDILEMEFGPNEGFDEVRMQSERLVSLTEELVLLARMEEMGKAERLIEFPITEVVEEAVAPFRALATNQGLKLHTDLTPMLTLHGDQKALTRLVSILMDNAVKYSPENGTISVTLKKQGRSLVLSVCNQTKQPVDPQSLHHVFDRFYRMDASRSSETGGHGIGLSIAQAIVTSHGGKISAWSKKPNSFGITAKFQ
jgi:signal transduction histidine kinase